MAASKPTYAHKMQLGQLLYFNGNLDGAINAFRYAATLNEKAFEPHLNLVNLYVQKGGDEGIQQAIEECNEVLKVKPTHKEVHLILGNLLRSQASNEKNETAQKEKLEAALKEIELSRQYGAPEAMIENTIGLILLQKGDTDGALEHINKAIKKQSNFPDAHLIRAVLLFKGAAKVETKGQDTTVMLKDLDSNPALKSKVDEVLQELDLAIKQKEKNAEAHNTKADILFAMGKHDDALEEYGKASEDDPRYAQAWAGQGNIHAQRKDYEKARESYRKAKELKATDKNIIYGLAVMLEKQGEIQEAIKEFQEGVLLESDPMMKAQITLHLQQLMNRGGFKNIPAIGEFGLKGSGGGGIGNNLFNDSLTKPFKDLIKIKPPAGKQAQDAPE